MNARWGRDVQTLGEAVSHNVHAMARWAPGACPCNVPSLTGASREGRVTMRITRLTALFAGRVYVTLLGERGIPCAGLARPHAFDRDPEVVFEVGSREESQATGFDSAPAGTLVRFRDCARDPGGEGVGRQTCVSVRNEEGG